MMALFATVFALVFAMPELDWRVGYAQQFALGWRAASHDVLDRAAVLPRAARTFYDLCRAGLPRTLDPGLANPALAACPDDGTSVVARPGGVHWDPGVLSPSAPRPAPRWDPGGVRLAGLLGFARSLDAPPVYRRAGALERAHERGDDPAAGVAAAAGACRNGAAPDAVSGICADGRRPWLVAPPLAGRRADVDPAAPGAAMARACRAAPPPAWCR